MEKKTMIRHKFFLSAVYALLMLSLLGAQEKQILTYVPGQEGYPFSEGLARVSDNRYYLDVRNDSDYEIFRKFGFINKEGALVIPFLYEEAKDFSEGLATVAARRGSNSNDLSYGFINEKGEEVIPLKFQDANSFGQGIAPVKIKDKWGYIDKRGNFVIPPQFYDAKPFSEHVASVSMDGNTWGFIDTTGKVILPYVYNDFFGFSEGVLAVRESGPFRTLINKKGERLGRFPQGISPITYCSEGLIGVSGGLDKKSKGALYGFANKQGEVVIPLIYEAVYEFREGLAAVKKTGKYGFINSDNKVIIPFIFNISEGEFKGAPPIFSEGLAFVKGGYINKKAEWVFKTYESK